MAESINVSKIICKYDDSIFAEAKKAVHSYLTFYYVNATYGKDMMIEKVCDYIELVKNTHHISFKELMLVYMEELSSMLNGKVEKEGRASKYYGKFKEIHQTVKKSKSGPTQRQIDDYTRIFLCLYSSYLKKEKSIKNVSFFFEDVDLKKIKKGIENEKASIPIPFVQNQKKYNTEDKYSKTSFALMFLSLIYFRIKNNVPESEK